MASRPPLSDYWARKLHTELPRECFFARFMPPPEPLSVWRRLTWPFRKVAWRTRDAWDVLLGRKEVE